MTDFTGWKQWGWNPPAFDSAWFREQNYGQGHRLRWSKVMKCPCVTVLHEPSQPLTETYTTPVKEGRPDCPSCYGRGLLYFGEQEITAPLMDFRMSPMWLQLFGSIADGGCLVSPEPEHLLNRRDRIVDLDEVRLYDEVCVRTGAVETPNTIRGTPTYAIATEQIPAGSDADPYIPATATRGVIYCRRADSEGRIQPDPLVYGTDFTITDAGAIEWLDAGTVASGQILVLEDGNEHAGETMPAGTVLYIGAAPGIPYAVTTADLFMYDFGDTTGGVVACQAYAAGTDYNQPVGTLLIPAFASLPDSDQWDVSLRIAAGFDQGVNPGEGGNIPAVGERYAIQYVCHPTYIVRLLPRAGRSSRVSNEPYIDMIDGFIGPWSPDEGEFPSGDIAVGDYWEVSVTGEFADKEFTAGDYLVALVANPSTTTYAGNWRRVPMFGGHDEDDTTVEHMPTAAMCWLEDMGDPFSQGGVS